MSTITMPLYTVNTLQLSKRLEKAGLKKEVAEELSEAIKDTQTQSLENLVTKQDLKYELVNLEEKLSNKIEILENRIIIKMFGISLLTVGLITWLDKIIH
jgi:hypothetical protein